MNDMKRCNGNATQTRKKRWTNSKIRSWLSLIKDFSWPMYECQKQHKMLFVLSEYSCGGQI